MPVLSFFVAKLVVEGGHKKAVIYLRHKYAGDEEVDLVSASEASLTAFCFPLGPESVVAKEFMASEEYTFTLTGGDGRRYHGFCRKFLPPKPAVGSRAQLPQVMCIISEDPWATFYFKVLQVLEQLIKSGDLLGCDSKELPSSSHAAQCLEDLGRQLSLNPRPSDIVRVSLPKSLDLMGFSPHRLLGSGNNNSAFSDEQLELQVPLDCGNGRWNCGVSLARLLWDVPIPALTTLLASMLLERRIVLVSSQRDTVTAAVQAASALLYPFKWHHIYLPMLPQAFKDYLSAPMPFMVGLQSQMLHMLQSIPVDEITVIDLDIRSCKPAPGTPQDDGKSLPWREHLEAALSAAHRVIRSPTEHETSPLIAGIVQEFFVKIFGNYRRFIHPDTPALNARWAAQVAAGSPAPVSGGMQGSPRPHHRESSSGRAPSTAIDGHPSGSGRGAAGDHVIKACGYVFEHTAFVRSHRRNEKARSFLTQFRGSQMYHMFVQEKLEAAAAGAQGQGERHQEEEPFEIRVNRYQERRRARFDKQRSSKGNVLARQWNNLIKKHRRTDSEEASMIGNLDLGGGGGLIANGIRRIITHPNNNLAAGVSSPTQASDIDPTSFFQLEDDDDDFEDLVDAGRGGDMMRDPEPFEGRILSAGSVHSGNSISTGTGIDRSTVSFAAPGMTGTVNHPHQAPINHRLSRPSQLPQQLGPSTSSSGQALDGPKSASVMDARQGLSVSMHPDGHKVYEGSFGSMLKSAVTGAVTEITSALGRRSTANITITPTSSSSGQPSASSAPLDKASGYRPQLTGDTPVPRSGLAKYMPQTTGGGLLDIGHVLDIANGRLRPPPASSRPLLQSQQQGSFSSSADVIADNRPGSALSTSMSQGNVQGQGQGRWGTSPAPLPLVMTPSMGPGGGASPMSSTTPTITATPTISYQNGSSTRQDSSMVNNGSVPQTQASTTQDSSPLIDGFDGFAALASAHAAPSASQPSNVSLLDL